MILASLSPVQLASTTSPGFLLSACVSLDGPDMQLHSALSSGDLEGAQRIYKSHFGNYEQTEFGVLNSYCSALFRLHEFDEHARCVDSLGRKAGIPDYSDENTALVYYQILSLRAVSM